MCQVFIPLLRKSEHARIVNVSSESGSLTVMGGGTPAYSVSKAALNALARMLADELRSAHILVNSDCPGWVATEMGGPDAPRMVEEGAEGVVWVVALPDDGPSGGFYRDGAARMVSSQKSVLGEEFGVQMAFVLPASDNILKTHVFVPIIDYSFSSSQTDFDGRLSEINVVI
jgi:NAD(P)-dependent dehydrogenase (short-subunit alcohol dehydrogenase family)